MLTLFRSVTYVNDGQQQLADILVENDCISCIASPLTIVPDASMRIFEGGLLLPGVIDEHIHSREPGLTHKGDLHTETLAAAAGGVTSVMDMPNVVPQTTTLETLDDRFQIGAAQSVVNYSFYFGATNTNAELLQKIDPSRVCGIKVFMGSSTGGMLVDNAAALRKIFACSPRPIVTHCEDTALINTNMQQAVSQYGPDPDIIHHPKIRSEEACYRSSSLAVAIARETGARLHVAHITTARELTLLDDSAETSIPHITGEICVPHLLFCEEDYLTLGTRIKCNPAIKTVSDRAALRRAMHAATQTPQPFLTIATDHAPHLLSEKEGGCQRAVSGMPMVQFSLVAMLNLVEEGVLSLENLVTLMSHHPARLFNIEDRGFIREGYKADLVRLTYTPWTLNQNAPIYSKCQWSPLEGKRFEWRVQQTFCNGQLVYNQGNFESLSAAEALRFGAN